MQGRASAFCSALLLVGVLSAAPAAACPWNGCGTDAYNAARTYDYYAPLYAYPLASGYAAPAYGYAYAPPAVAYGYAPPAYAYVPPAYGYANPAYSYGPPVYGYGPQGYAVRR